MAVLHKEFTSFNGQIALTSKKKEDLIKSRADLRRKIKKWFTDNKPDELQPKFYGQGSFEMNTTVNPIAVEDDSGNKLYKYDLDYGVYFIEKAGEDNRRGITTLHDWVFNSVENHTNQPPIKKNTCIRVVFSDGHHIDLPIYYKDNEIPKLAHKCRGWFESDPKAFTDWFNSEVKENQQIRRLVRYLKAWKNFRELRNTSLSLPSGFALSILAVNNYMHDENDDVAFRQTIEKIKETLDSKFECIRPTIPEENVFSEYSDTKTHNFLTTLQSLIDDCNRAENEQNFKKASEIMQKQFGHRFPTGKDENENTKSKRLGTAIVGANVIPKPYAE